MGKDMEAKRVRQWGLQVKAYFESRTINIDVNHFILTQFLLRDHALEWWMIQNDAKPN
jgi:hypothetical protein